MACASRIALWVGLVATPCLGWGQKDLDSLDVWLRQMHPDPFIRCGEQAWDEALSLARSEWPEPDASKADKARAVNRLLQVLQDSHTAASTWHWAWAVERQYGTVPVRWAIEGEALWTLDSAIPGLPEEVRILELNGVAAEQCVRAGMDLANMEGYSPDGARRTAAHALTPWVLGHTQSSQLAIVWLDPQSGRADTTIVAAWPWRKSGKAWNEISTKRLPIEWTFPDGSALGSRDARRVKKRADRIEASGRTARIQTSWDGAAVVKITSFAQGSWRRYQRQLRLGFERARDLDCPVIIDLRGNPGGQSPRMEALWRQVGLVPRHLPYALVAKQSPATAKVHRKFYRGLRKRWVDRHKDTSPDARYIYRMATLPAGQTDTLTFGQQRVAKEVFKGAVALIIDGESASATVSFAGAFQATRRGPVFGEPCLGPSVGTMGNPHLKVLPDSRVVVSLSTAVYMAQATKTWAQSQPIRPDVYIPTMWRRSSSLASQIQDWIHPPILP